MLNCFRLWRRRRKVLVEYAQNNQSFRRLIQRTDDLESFHKALLDAFEDELVPVIAGATGLTEYDVKNYKEPLRISNVIQLTCLSEASGRSPIADGKEITDCEVLRVDIQDTMTINTTAFIEDQVWRLTINYVYVDFQNIMFASIVTWHPGRAQSKKEKI